MQKLDENGDLLIRSAGFGCLLWVTGIGGGLAIGGALAFKSGELWRAAALVATMAPSIWVALRLSATSARFDDAGCVVVQFSGSDRRVAYHEIDRVVAGPFPSLALRDGSSVTLWCAIDDGDLAAVVTAVASGGSGKEAPTSVSDELNRVSTEQRRVKIALVAAVVIGYSLRFLTGVW